MPVSASHLYVQQHYHVPAEPDRASRFKGIKRFVGRCIAHFTSAQNAFNANVVRTLDHLQQQHEAAHAQLDALAREAASAHELLRELHLSRVQGDEIHRNLTAALEQVRDMQQHHGTVIGMLQQRADAVTPLISQCQKTTEHVIGRLRTMDQAMTDLALRQDDLLAGLQHGDDIARGLNARQDDIMASLQRVDDIVRGISAQHNDLVGSIHDTTARLEHLVAALQTALAQQGARQDDLVHAQERLATEHAGVIARQDDAVRTVAGLAERFADGMRQAGEVGARITRAEEGFTMLRDTVERLETHVAMLRQSLSDIVPQPATRPSARAKKQVLEHLQRVWNDAEYQQFEAAQRGSEADVRARMQWCQEVLAPITTSAHEYILDLGCGRGELLALMEANGKHARGVDVNKVAVSAARARGLHVSCHDVFAALEGTAPQSLAAVTAFHLIEHFEYTDIARLVREVMRVLRPGGLFICETPNALNLRVAASEFYQDPTHVRPVHPALLHHLLRTAGFTAVEFRFLHPFPPDEQLQCTVSGHDVAVRDNFEKLNTLVWGNRDCACIARKEDSA